MRQDRMTRVTDERRAVPAAPRDLVHVHHLPDAEAVRVRQFEQPDRARVPSVVDVADGFERDFVVVRRRGRAVLFFVGFLVG